MRVWLLRCKENSKKCRNGRYMGQPVPLRAETDHPSKSPPSTHLPERKETKISLEKAWL